MSDSPSLVVTLGPRSWGLAGALVGAGATAIRLNASHIDPAELPEVLAAVARDVPPAWIVLDLQGAKMRLGRMVPRDVRPGDRVRFALADGDGLPVPHREFFEQARPGDTVSVDDGRIRFEVVRSDRDGMEALALDSGRVEARKGVNLQEHPVVLEGLTGADRAAVASARTAGVSAFAFSFMSDGREAAWLRDLGPGSRVIGKVERLEAAGQVDGLAKRVDALWICRGDLGVQLGQAGLARFVAAFTPAGRLPVPVLMAGQVLEHLTRHREPTRSEVCHLYDLAARGYAGIVLSDETAIGDDPLHATRIAAELLRMFLRAPGVDPLG